MTRIKLPHSAIAKSPGLLPMLYTVRELSESIGVVQRTLRDWLAAGAPHFYDRKGHIWIEGKEFADWIANLRKPKRESRLTDHEAYCVRCKQVVKMVNPIVTVVRGKLMLHKGKCPNCHCTINREGRKPNSFIHNMSAERRNGSGKCLFSKRRRDGRAFQGIS